MVLDGVTQVLAIDLLGALAGALLALLFLPPKNRFEFRRRFLLSLLSGVIFADPARTYLGWEPIWQKHLAASAGVAMLSWFLVGAAIRIINRWTPPKDE